MEFENENDFNIPDDDPVAANEIDGRNKIN